MPLLLVLPAAPYFAGKLDPLPGLWLSTCAWLSLILFLIQRPKGSQAPLWLAWLLAAFPLLAGLSLVNSADPGATIVQAALYASYACVGWLCLQMVRQGRGSRVLGAILVGAFVIAGDGLAEYASWARLGSTERVLSRFENANLLAAYLAPAAVLMMGLAPTRPASFRPLLWGGVTAVFAAVLGAAVVSTGSRGGLAALAAGLIVTLSLLVARRSLRAKGSVLLLVVALAALTFGATRTWAVFQVRQTERGGATTSAAAPREAGSASSDSNRFRLLTWRGALHMGQTRPFLGWGAGSFAASYGPHARAAYTSHAHSSYLQILAEQGVPALLIWILNLGAAVLGLRSLYSSSGLEWVPAAAGALASLAAHSIFEPLHGAPALGILLWTVTGIGLAGWSGRAAEQPREVRVRRWPAAALAVGGLALTGLLAVGLYHLRLAQASMVRQPASAVKPLAVAAALVPLDPDLHAARAFLFQSQQEPLRAVAAARRVVGLRPFSPDSYLLLGNLLRQAGRPDEALDAYRQALACAPMEMDLLCLYAAALEERQRTREALEVYRRMVVLEQSPEARLQPHRRGEYRYIRAHRALIAEARRTGNREQLRRYQQAAATLLAGRRKLFDANPAGYRVDYVNEVRLRNEERELWKQLAVDLRAVGEKGQSEAALREYAATSSSLDRLKSLPTSGHGHTHL